MAERVPAHFADAQALLRTIITIFSSRDGPAHQYAGNNPSIRVPCVGPLVGPCVRNASPLPSLAEFLIRHSKRTIRQ